MIVASNHHRIVITGIGLLASVGATREKVWQALREGRSGVRRLTGLPAIPDGLMIGAPVEIATDAPGRLRVVAMARHAAAEALGDAQLDWRSIDRDRFACAISGHMGDSGWFNEHLQIDVPTDPNTVPWWQQFMPNTACSTVANHFGLYGPRLAHSTACASGLVEVLSAIRAIETEQCEYALAGSAEAFHPLFAAGFRALRVLAEHDDPTQASRPFDRGRRGFVMGEGSAMFVLERLDHALARGAKIYAEVLGRAMLADAFHVTGVDADTDALTYLISETMRRAAVSPDDVQYINAHGTGTQQNDVAEARAIRRALGQAADQTWVSSTKSMLGHLVNAAGSVELAVTTLALRDGYVPPTINLTDPDPDCDLDCVPLYGRRRAIDTALKVSVAFGGHLVGAIVRRWPGIKSILDDVPASTKIDYRPARRVA